MAHKVLCGGCTHDLQPDRHTTCLSSAHPLPTGVIPTPTPALSPSVLQASLVFYLSSLLLLVYCRWSTTSLYGKLQEGRNVCILFTAVPLAPRTGLGPHRYSVKHTPN